MIDLNFRWHEGSMWSFGRYEKCHFSLARINPKHCNGRSLKQLNELRHATMLEF